MDPTNRGPEEYGHEGEDTSRAGDFEPGAGQPPRPRSSRDPLTNDFGQHSPALARTVRLVAGAYVLTVNPVDGSEIELSPPQPPAPTGRSGGGSGQPQRPPRRTPAQRAEAARAARPPAPAGVAPAAGRLLGRQDEREQLVRLLARGRSVRLTGPGGSGRTSLLDLVAEDCEDLAPDGVVRLSGHRRTADDLLHDLFHAVHDAPRLRPDDEELLTCVREIGAVVVVDDLEFGGPALDGLLDATPECAFLLGATPDVPAPSADSTVEEVALTGLGRAGGVEVIEGAVGRALTEEEANWAGDLWFESEGLPLRFVQAGALLRQHDRLRADAEAVDAFGVFEDARPFVAPVDSGAGEAEEIPLPSLGEAAAPAPLLAARLSPSARAALRFAVALGGEVPHQAHLPALVGDTHADAALGELVACGLVSPAGSRYRLAAGVRAQLEAAGYADDLDARARTAAQHYAWWAAHPSVTPERVCAEADALLAALAVTGPATEPPAEGEQSTAVELARAAAPAFAAGLHWAAWEEALHEGAEAARLAGESADRAYFHHELGVLALCAGQLDRARSELEASLALRNSLADKRGTTVGRRALALVADRSGDVPGGDIPGPVPPPFTEDLPEAAREETATQPRSILAALPSTPATGPTLAAKPAAAGPPPAHRRGGLRGLARRHVVAVGAGALLVAVLGTVVTLGATSDRDADTPTDRGGLSPTAGTGLDDGVPAADTPDDGSSGGTGTATGGPTSADPGPTQAASDSPTPTDDPRPSDSPSRTAGPGGGPSSSPSPSAPTSPSPRPTPSGGTPSASSSGSPSPSATPTPSASPGGGSTPSNSVTASRSTGASPSPATEPADEPLI